MWSIAGSPVASSLFLSETARKAFNRLWIVIRHAAALGFPVDLQACEKARLLLGKPRHEAKHIPAMPWQDVPAFYKSLVDGTVTHLALRLPKHRQPPDIAHPHNMRYMYTPWILPGCYCETP